MGKSRERTTQRTKRLSFKLQKRKKKKSSTSNTRKRKTREESKFIRKNKVKDYNNKLWLKVVDVLGIY